MIFIDAKEGSTAGMKKVMDFLSKENREYKLMPLVAGDVIVQGEKRAYVIEIKRGNDLVASLNSDRMWNELAKIKALKIDDKEAMPILLFQGNARILSQRFAGSYVKDGEKKTKYVFRSKGELKSELARLHSILHAWKVPMMITADDYQTAVYLTWLDETIDKEKKEKTINISVLVDKELPPDRMAFEVLGAIVGVKTAMAILRREKSLYNVIVKAKEQGEKAFEDITYENGRKVSKSLIRRLIDVVRAEVNV
jgi:ERCC4-type nuclease